MTATENKLRVVKESVIENYFHAILYDNGVIEIIWDKSIETIDTDHLNKAREIYVEFGGGKKMPLCYSTHDFLHISNDGRKLAASKEYTKYSLAIAVMVDGLAMRLVLNFFMRFNKPTVPTKGFSNKDAAMRWLEGFKIIEN